MKERLKAQSVCVLLALVISGCANPPGGQSGDAGHDNGLKLTMRPEWQQYFSSHYQASVKRRIKAPATTQFPSDGATTPPMVVYYPQKNETRMFALVSYDSQNSYGALIRGNILVLYKCAGNAAERAEPVNWQDDSAALP